MTTDKSKDVIEFMSRHFLALTCDYESLNEDGTVFHEGTTAFSGFLLELHGRHFWVTAGHCLKEELDEKIEEGVLRVTGGGFIDYFGHEATHHHMVPYTYEAECAFYMDEAEHGLDFAVLMLDTLQQRAFAANGLVPITRLNWIHQPNLTFDFYRMLGIPADRVFHGTSDIQVQQAMVAVNQISIDDVGEPPAEVEVPSDAWFIGRIDPGAKIKDIKGMSGGPIYGFRKDKGRLTYHVVALQSRWWDTSRTIFGCSVPLFAESLARATEHNREE